MPREPVRFRVMLVPRAAAATCKRGRRLVGAQRLRGGITRQVKTHRHQRLRQSARIASTRSGVTRP